MNQGKTNMGRIEELEAILNKPLVRNNAKEMMRAAIEAIALAKRVGDDDLLAFAEEIKNEIKTMAARHAERLKTRMEKGLPSFQSRIKARHKNHLRLIAAKPVVFSDDDDGEEVERDWEIKGFGVEGTLEIRDTNASKVIWLSRVLWSTHRDEYFESWEKPTAFPKTQSVEKEFSTRAAALAHFNKTFDDFVKKSKEWVAADKKQNPNRNKKTKSARLGDKVEFAPISGRTGVNDREKMVVIDQAIKASGMAEMDIKKTYPDIRQSIERIRKNPGFYSLRDAESVAYKIKQLKAMSSRPGAKAKFGYEKTVTLLLEDAGIDSAEFDFRDGVLLVSPSIDGNAVKKALQDAIKSGKITKAPQVKRSNFARPGAKVKMAEKPVNGMGLRHVYKSKDGKKEARIYAHYNTYVVHFLYEGREGQWDVRTPRFEFAVYSAMEWIKDS